MSLSFSEINDMGYAHHYDLSPLNEGKVCFVRTEQYSTRKERREWKRIVRFWHGNKETHAIHAFPIWEGSFELWNELTTPRGTWRKLNPEHYSHVYSIKLEDMHNAVVWRTGVPEVTPFNESHVKRAGAWPVQNLFGGTEDDEYRIDWDTDYQVIMTNRPVTRVTVDKLNHSVRAEWEVEGCWGDTEFVSKSFISYEAAKAFALAHPELDAELWDAYGDIVAY